MAKDFSIKLVALDVDGTILDGDDNISEQTIAQVRRVKSLGVQVCLATGRPLFAAEKVIHTLDIETPSMFFSGALVWDPKSKSSLASHSFSTEELLPFLTRVRESELFYELYSATEYFTDCPGHLSQLHGDVLGIYPRSESAETVLKDHAIIKFNVLAESAEDKRKMRQIIDQFPNFNYGLGYMAGWPNIEVYNITCKLANRRDAFRTLIQATNVSSNEVMAIGDAESDLIFFELAGLGVAMGQADDSIKAKAGFVTKTIKDDGVAFALENFI